MQRRNVKHGRNDADDAAIYGDEKAVCRLYSFYRLGDFYEMFLRMRLRYPKSLNLRLPERTAAWKNAPHVRRSYHAVEELFGRLVSKGYKVAICEQVGGSEAGKGACQAGSGAYSHSGTNLNIQSLEENKNNFLMCIAYFAGKPASL